MGRQRRHHDLHQPQHRIGAAFLQHLQQAHSAGVGEPPASGWGTTVDLSRLLAMLTEGGTFRLGEHVTLSVPDDVRIRIVDRGDVSRWELIRAQPIVEVRWRFLRLETSILHVDFARDLSEVVVGLQRCPDWSVRLEWES